MNEQMQQHLSDLVVDSKLDVTVHARHVVQRSYISNPLTGQRPTRVEELWQRTRELGKGSFGVVWLETCAKGPSRGQLRAVKEMQKDTAGATLHRELEAIAKFSQKRYRDHFVQSLGWYENDCTVFIAMEYLSLGDLEGHFNSVIREDEACLISRQVLEGLQFMHDNQYVHRDIKPSNILVLHQGPGWWVKIADFGISKRLAGSTAFRTAIGTPAYVAPEVIGIRSDNGSEDDVSYTFAVDIWAVGAITFEMITGQLPFPVGNRKLIDYVILGHPFPFEPATRDSLSDEFLNFIESTMAASPHDRPAAAQALSCPWMQKQQFFVPGSWPFESHLSTTNTNEAPNEVDTANSGLWETITEKFTTLLTGSAAGPPLNTATMSDKPRLEFRLTQRLQNGKSTPYSVMFSPDGNHLAVGYTYVKLWKLDPQGRFREFVEFRDHSEKVNAITFSSDGRRLVSLAADQQVCIRDIDGSAKLQRSQILPQSTTKAIAFLPNGRRLAVGLWNGTVVIWEPDSSGNYRPTQRAEDHTDPVSYILFSPDGHRMVTGGVWGSRTIKVWQTNLSGQFQQVGEIDAVPYTVFHTLALSNNGCHLAAAADTTDNMIVIWEADRSGAFNQVQKLNKHSDRVTSVEFSLDGRWLATASFDLTVLIWEKDQSGRFQEFQALCGFADRVDVLHLSPDGRRLAIGTRDVILIWEMS